MDPKRFGAGAVVGGITMYLVGYLVFDLAFADFYAANRSHVMARGTPILWAIWLGTLSLAALITFAVGRDTGAPTIGAGARTGAIVNFLAWCGVDFLRYGGADYMTLTVTVVDPLLEIVRGAITGAAIAVVLSKVGAHAEIAT